jgi:hypothetical protein
MWSRSSTADDVALVHLDRTKGSSLARLVTFASIRFGRPDAKEDNKAIFPRSHGGLDQERVWAYLLHIFRWHLSMF